MGINPESLWIKISHDNKSLYFNTRSDVMSLTAPTEGVNNDCDLSSANLSEDDFVELSSGLAQESVAPTWLCGHPPQNRWDADKSQAVYGRISGPMFYLLVILQLKVPLEAIITYR